MKIVKRLKSEEFSTIIFYLAIFSELVSFKIRTYFITVSSDPHEEIVRFNIAMDEILGMNVLHPSNHLIRQHQNRLDGKSARTKVEQVLQRRAKQIHNQHVVLPLLSIPAVNNKNVTGSVSFKEIHNRIHVILTCTRLIDCI